MPASHDQETNLSRKYQAEVKSIKAIQERAGNLEWVVHTSSFEHLQKPWFAKTEGQHIERLTATLKSMFDQLCSGGHLIDTDEIISTLPDSAGFSTNVSVQALTLNIV